MFLDKQYRVRVLGSADRLSRRLGGSRGGARDHVLLDGPARPLPLPVWQLAWSCEPRKMHVDPTKD